MLRRYVLLSAALGVLVSLYCGGCGRIVSTMPDRAATEQLLMSTAADRAVRRLCGDDVWQDKKIFLDLSRFKAYDQEYASAALRGMLSGAGGRLVENREDADLVIEAASGALSMDRSEWLLGIPELELPIPMAGNAQTPELAIFKNIRQRGKAKYLLYAYDARTLEPVVQPNTALGSARYTSWWLLFTGPWNFTNLPRMPRETRD